MKKHIALAALIYLVSPPIYAATPNLTCNGQSLMQTLSSGTKWSVCWSVRPEEGIVLSDVTYQAPNQSARRVLGEASLSQLQTVFDDGSPTQFATSIGLGGTHLQTITPNQCENGTLYNANNRAVLCGTVRNHGYLYRSTTQRQGQYWELSSRSIINSRTYTVRWRLYDNGSIEPSLGLSGELPIVNGTTAQYGWPAMANGKIATAFTDHALWRLDFDLAATPNNDVIEEFTSTPSADRLRKTKAMQTILTETARSQDPEVKRFWRIRDNRISAGVGLISYEIVPENYDMSRANSTGSTWLNNDIFFTRYKPCEKNAANNATTDGCASNVSQFINAESLSEQDVVIWYKQNYHHLPRSEDSNRISTIWSSFLLLPRDWHSTNPL